MVIVRLKGGLGNILFQVNLARYLISKGATVKYDCRLVSRALLVDLSKMNIQIDHATPLDIYRCLGLVGLHTSLQGKLKRLLRPVNYVTDSSFSFLSNGYYDGYWQNVGAYGCFLSISYDVHIDFPLISQNCESSSLVIHVRGGDYFSSPNHIVLSFQYYLNAISIMLSKKSEIENIVLVTDDVLHGKKLIDRICQSYSKMNVSIVCESVLEDFALLANSDYLIIANSTFSFWAALLGNSKKEIVIYPSNWFKDVEKNKNWRETNIKETWIGAL